MVEVTFSYHSVRARNARIASKIGIPRSAEWAGVLSTSATAGYLLSEHHASGFALAGLSLGIGMLSLWHHWDLESDESPQGLLSNDRIQLERVAERRLLARLFTNQTPVQLWVACLPQWEAIFIIKRLNLDYAAIAKDLQSTGNCDAIWAKSVELGRTFSSSLLDSGVVICATLLISDAVQDQLRKKQIKSEDIMAVLAWQQRIGHALKTQKSMQSGIGRDWASGYTPLLQSFGSNLSQSVEAGLYQYQPEHHQEVIRQMLEQISQNRPVALVGGVGSGKTSLMRALADRLIRDDGVGQLSYYQVVSLNSSVLLANEHQLEGLMLELLGEAAAARNTILFLDDAQLFLNTGTGSVDLSSILLPFLQKNVVKIVLALSDRDWQNLSAKQPAMAASLHRLNLSPASKSETIAVLQDVAIGVEHSTGATVLQSAITESISLSERYLPEAVFPGKAVTILEAAGSYVQSGLISPASVQQAVESMTGAKVVKASAPEKRQLLNLEQSIHKRMINQDKAVSVVANALRRSGAGVSNPHRPVGSFLFLGPTGVGKTELAKALAAVYYGAESSMIRLDMSEYQQPSDVGRLLSPAGASEAGQTLTGAVRQSPSSVVLLDEVDKAHPDVLNLLLQMLDEGHLTDQDGRRVSFKDAIIIATSNAGADEIREHIANGESVESFEESIVEGLIQRHELRPELLNRFDEVVVFRPLTEKELHEVVLLLLKSVNSSLEPQGVTVTLSAEAVAWLAKRGYEPAFGARPLRRLIQRTVENLVAERLLAGTIKSGDTVALDVADLDPSPQPS